METISLKEALRLTIIEKYRKPVITEQEIAKCLYRLYIDKTYNEVRIGKISKNEPDHSVLRKSIIDLIAIGVIKQIGSLQVYSLSSQSSPSAQQIACAANPYSYVGYLNAMEIHGLTDRIPKSLHLITCSVSKFRELADAEIKKEFPNVLEKTPITPRRIVKLPILDGKRIEFHQKKDFILPKEKANSNGVKISPIGDTFISMLQEPELCGGFSHVLAVFDEYATEYLPLIIRAIDKRGSAMDKARAGYILQERLGIQNSSIEEWKTTVKRGGSRKLIASKPYIDTYSETWCISLNNN